MGVSVGPRLRLLLAGIVVLTVFAFNVRPFSPSMRPRIQSDAYETAHQPVARSLGKLPLAFEPNVGQTDAAVKFIARAGTYQVFLTDRETVITLQTADTPRNPRDLRRRRERQSANPAIRLTLAGAQPGAQLLSRDRLAGVSNYARGNDPSKWQMNVPRYARVRHVQAFPGVDLEYYGSERQLEFDYIVEPGASPESIAFDVAGADRLAIDGDGNLQIAVGDAHVALRRPVAYQQGERRREPVESRYELEGGRARLHVGAYDRARTLVVDPVLEYTKILGGSAADFGAALALDGSGNAYVAGITGSSDFPATGGAAQTTFGGGIGMFGFATDAFVAKVNAAGTDIVYATYLGGNGDDFAFGIAVDASGNAYTAGFTSQGASTPFPTTNGAFQTTFQGGDGDIFVTKLNGSGALVYSTFVGGGCDDLAWNLTLDASTNVYLAAQSVRRNGCTQNFPVTNGVYQTTPGTAGADGIVVKLNAAGSALIYATYLHGSTPAGCCPDDWVQAIAVDSSGNAYLAGTTETTNFPTTVGAYQTSYGGGPEDGWVAKLNTDATGLLYSTMLGGSGTDEVLDLAIDGSGNAYVTGNSDSGNFPTTGGAYQTAHGPGADAFVTKINSTGTALVYSTLLGGTTGAHGASQAATGIAVDASGNAYVVGHTRASNFPTTAGAIQSSYAGGTEGAGFIVCEHGYCDGFFAKFNSTGTSLLYSTYLGGPGNDDAARVALSGTSVFIVGSTGSGAFPPSPVSIPDLSGLSDAYVLKLNLAAAGFTDEPIVGGVTPVRTVHITELRTRVDAVRNAHSLGAYTYTNPTLTPGTTMIKAVDVTELRTALGEAYTAASMTPPTYTDPSLSAGTIVKAVHITQLRAAVVALE
jgi:beta-propeller repeat-containing protein